MDCNCRHCRARDQILVCDLINVHMELFLFCRPSLGASQSTPPDLVLSLFWDEKVILSVHKRNQTGLFGIELNVDLKVDGKCLCVIAGIPCAISSFLPTATQWYRTLPHTG